MNNRYKNLIISLLLSALGTAFLIYYIFRASTDVVASDYIRIINYYLKDVTDLHYLLSWEGISRIPFTFLARFINVKYFGYSVYFDKILGTLGLFIFNTVVLSFILNNIKSKIMHIISSILITYLSFSLMAWEMILNGTGYAHFITVGLIALTFRIFSNIWASTIGVNYRNHKVLFPCLCILIIITSLVFAGSYTVSYNCTIILFTIILFVFGIINNKKKYYAHLFLIIISVICLFLYFKSNSTGEALIPVGFKDITLFELIKTEPLFPIRFLLKSLASSIIGVETFDYAINFKTISEKMIFFIGFLYLIVIIYAIIILIYKIVQFISLSKSQVRDKQGTIETNTHKENNLSLFIFICMFVTYGIANYLLVFLARYKFVVDSYGMTSRYSLQYMFLTIGIVILLIKLLDDYILVKNAAVKNVNIKRIYLIIISILSLSFISLGHLTTNTDEIFKADYRKIIYGILEDKAKNYKDIGDEDLENSFEYHRGPEQIREALSTLEEQHLNIFK